jgi:MarC family integral membrane protein
MLLYGLINSVGVIPIYLRLVQRTPSARAHRTIMVAAVAVASLLIIAAILGRQVRVFFNVGLDDFRIAGGLLALVIAFDMFSSALRGFIGTTSGNRSASGPPVAAFPECAARSLDARAGVHLARAIQGVRHAVAGNRCVPGAAHVSHLFVFAPSQR